MDEIAPLNEAVIESMLRMSNAGLDRDLIVKVKEILRFH